MFKEALSIMRKDKLIMLCSCVPIIIGLLLYFFLGSWLYNDVMSAGNEYLKSKTDGWAGALSYFFGALLMVGFYFVVNWTLVLLISLIAAPFNDLISARVEKIKRGKVLPSIKESFFEAFSRFFKMIKNEIKKIIFIIILSLMAFGLSFIFPPLGYFISAILVAVSFIDYSWSRNEFSFRDCLADFKKAIFRYSFGGAIFIILIGTPIVNIFSFPVGVVYFTLHFLKNNLQNTEA